MSYTCISHVLNNISSFKITKLVVCRNQVWGQHGFEWEVGEECHAYVSVTS